MNNIYQLSKTQVLSQLETCPTGLSSVQAQQRLKQNDEINDKYKSIY